MKKLISLSAIIFVLFSSSVFAANTAKKADAATGNDAIVVEGLQATIGIAVNLERTLSAKPTIVIRDIDNHVLYSGRLSNNAGTAKAYDLSQLDYGDYFITVRTKGVKVEKQVHIYNEDGQKTYFIMQ